MSCRFVCTFVYMVTERLSAIDVCARCGAISERWQCPCAAAVLQQRTAAAAAAANVVRRLARRKLRAGASRGSLGALMTEISQFLIARPQAGDGLDEMCCTIQGSVPGVEERLEPSPASQFSCQVWVNVFFLWPRRL